MRVLIPGLREKIKNPFFEEISELSTNSFEYCHWSDIKPEKDDVILFQWPELIFEWEEPTSAELKELQEKIKSWKTNHKILYLVHNEKRHYGMTELFKTLYHIVETAADIFIHFGEYSESQYSNLYSDKKHCVIHHPLYENSFSIKNKNKSRKKLNIALDRTVLIAPGVIRNFEERGLLLKAFKAFPAKKKTLIAPAMKWKSTKLDFRGRTRLKRLVDIKKIVELKDNFFNPPKYYFGYSYSSPKELSIKISAADAVIIPRLDILNSGNFYLGLTFNKPIVGPSKGNLREHMEEV